MGFMLLSGTLETFGLISIAPFLGIVADPGLINKHSLINLVYTSLGFSEPQYFIAFLGTSFLFTIIFSSILTAVLLWRINRFVQNTTARLTQDLFRNYLFMPYSFFLATHTSEISKNILNEVSRAVELVIYPFLIAVAKSVVSVLIVLMLFFADPIIATASLLIFSGYYVLAFFYVQKRLGAIGEATTNTIATRYKIISEAISGIKEIKLTRKEEERSDSFKLPSEQLANYIVKSHLAAAVPKILIEIVTYSIVITIIVYLALTEANYGKRISIIALYGLAAYRLIPALHIVYNSFTQIKFNFGALVVLSDKLSTTSNPHNHERHLVKMDFPQTVKIDNVSYRYPDSKTNALENICFEFSQGSKIGLVGQSGAGKSTLVDVLLGLLDVKSGDIYLDNIRLTSQNLGSWQGNISYVPQDIFLLDGTIEQNIAFHLGQQFIDKEKLKTAIDQSALNEFINFLPAREKTFVGERGVRLSGGEKQRIGIARALYRNANLIVLDEATSALDSITQREITQSLNKLATKPAIITIAHRISTVRTCDIIFVLNNGRIVSKGSFEHLSKNCQYFQNLSK